MKRSFNHPILLWLLENSTFALFMLIFLIFGALSLNFLSTQSAVNILIQSSSLAIAAYGMTFVLLTAGIDLSVGAIMFLSAVVAGKMIYGGYPVWLAFSAIVLVGTIFGGVNAFLITKLRMLPFIVTLASLSIGRGFGLYLTNTRAINLPSHFTEIGSSRILWVPFPIFVMLIMLFLSYYLLNYTAFGRQIYAVGNSVESARKAGLPVGRILALVYILSGFFAAVGGMVYLAQVGAVPPEFGRGREFQAIAAAVLGGTSLFGGRGNVFPGTLLGALLVQMVESGLIYINADPYLFPLITAAVIFLVVWADSVRYIHLQRLKRRKIRIESPEAASP